MKDYLNEINDRFPVRRKTSEKSAFFDYVSSDLGCGRVRKDIVDKNDNIIIGNVEKAKVVFTAHYDTPAASLVPNFMVPANKLFGTLINICYPIGIALISLLLGFGFGTLLELDYSGSLALYLIIYFTAFYCLTRLVSNKNNKNDNTSGVATVMSLAAKYNDDRVAFILFDNEEKGLLGSKAYSKKYKSMMKDKLLINLDCVGNGDQFVFIAKETAEKTEGYKILREAFGSDNGDFTIHYLPFKKSLGNSDHKNFLCSVGVMAASRGRVLKLITGRIHTVKDTVADANNITFLSEKLGIFIERL